MEDSFYLFEEIADHARIYLSQEDNLELVFSPEEELTKDIVFSIDVYEESSDIYANHLYLISSNREDN